MKTWIKTLDINRKAMYRKTGSLFLIALVVGLINSCYVDPADEFLLPDDQPERDEIAWTGETALLWGDWARMSQASDSSMIYMVRQTASGIRVCKSTNSGQAWLNDQNIIPIPGPGQTSASNPSIFAMESGEVLVAYTRTVEEEKTGIGLMLSSDYGDNWSFMTDVVAPEAGGLPPGQPFLLSVDGEVFCYYSQKLADTIPLYHLWLTRSTDLGGSWSAPEKIMDESILELDGSVRGVSVTRTSGGDYVMVFQGKDMIYTNRNSVLASRSTDGIQWSEPVAVYSFPNVARGYGAGDPYVATLKDGRLVATFQYGANGGKFGLSLSNDEGLSWNKPLEMFEENNNYGTSVFVSDNELIFAVSAGLTLSIGTNDPAIITKMRGASLNKPVTASTFLDVTWDNFKPENVVDGDPLTRWSSEFGETAWIMVDLEEEYFVEKVEIDWEEAYSAQYNILVSTDGENFTVVHVSETNCGGIVNDHRLDEIGFDPPVQARYVKLQGNSRCEGNIWGHSIWEFKVIGDKVEQE